MKKNNIPLIEKELKNKTKMIALVAPSFVSTFDYPQFIHQLRDLGFDKVAELTFGAKMINREYHKILMKSKKLVISTTCPGITNTIKGRYPQYVKNLIKVDSPMIATAKICKKIYPGYKTCFISPCDLKKIEAENSKYVDYVIDYEQLENLFLKNKIKANKNHIHFNKFYNDYTKIYPLSGGLSKTAHLKGVLKKGEEKTIDGIEDVMKFLDDPEPNVKFLDVTFCKGGCMGGNHVAKIPLSEKRKKLMHYMEIAREEDIPKGREGLIEKAKGISFKL
jgi:iron only hydrogenase large subunit-like protein